MTNDAATMSMSCSTPKAMSDLSFSESGGSSVTTPGRLTPFRSPISEVLRTVHATVPSALTAVTSNEMRPSSRRTVVPGASFCASSSYPTYSVDSSDAPSNFASFVSTMPSPAVSVIFAFRLPVSLHTRSPPIRISGPLVSSMNAFN